MGLVIFDELNVPKSTKKPILEISDKIINQIFLEIWSIHHDLGVFEIKYKMIIEVLMIFSQEQIFLTKWMFGNII